MPPPHPEEAQTIVSEALTASEFSENVVSVAVD